MKAGTCRDPWGQNSCTIQSSRVPCRHVQHCHWLRASYCPSMHLFSQCAAVCPIRLSEAWAHVHRLASSFFVACQPRQVERGGHSSSSPHCHRLSTERPAAGRAKHRYENARPPHTLHAQAWRTCRAGRAGLPAAAHLNYVWVHKRHACTGTQW